MVHRTSITEDKQFILQLLRDQIKQKVYPIHRLDRGTSGVLFFAKMSESASQLGKLFQEKLIQKQYLAIVRGYLSEKDGTIDYPLAKEKWLAKKEAISHYRSIQQTEINHAIGRYETARYSLVQVFPETGRRHQIRRHFSHLRHPIIGDKRHGDVKHNTYWRETFGISRMLLHAQKLSFIHPILHHTLSIKAPLNDVFIKATTLLGFNIEDGVI